MAVSVGYTPPTPPIEPQGVRFNSNAVELQTVSFAKASIKLKVLFKSRMETFVGSRVTNFIGVYSN